MTVVQGQDKYSGLELAPLESYQEVPGTGNFKRVPLAGENMNLEYQQIPTSEEISSIGAVETLEVGQGYWRGTFRTLMYYNAPWFHWLMCQLVGGCEFYAQDTLVTGAAAPGATPSVNTHVYIPQSFKSNQAGSESGITWGLGARIFKMGPNNTSGYGHRIDDLHVQSAVFEFPADGWPTVTWTVVGLYGATLDLSAVEIKTQEAGEYPIKPGDIGRDPAHAQTPSLSTAGIISGTRNIRDARITFNNGIDFGPRWANAFDGVQRAGHEGKFSVEAAFSTLLEQDELNGATSGSLYPSWVASLMTNNFARLRAISQEDGGGHNPPQFPLADQTNDQPYALDIWMPNTSFRSMQAPLDRGDTIQQSWTVKAFQGTVTSAGSAFSASQKAPIAFSFQVNRLDEEQGPDGKFNKAAEGGNDPHSTLAA